MTAVFIDKTILGVEFELPRRIGSRRPRGHSLLVQEGALRESPADQLSLEVDHDLSGPRRRADRSQTPNTRSIDCDGSSRSAREAFCGGTRPKNPIGGVRGGRTERSADNFRFSMRFDRADADTATLPELHLARVD